VDYYQVIREPIDLRTIAQKIQSSAYQILDDMHKDLMLMIQNAKFFNKPSSLIYKVWRFDGSVGASWNILSQQHCKMCYIEANKLASANEYVTILAHPPGTPMSNWRITWTLPFRYCKHCSGRLRNKSLDRIWSSNNLPPADLSRCSILVSSSSLIWSCLVLHSIFLVLQYVRSSWCYIYSKKWSGYILLFTCQRAEPGGIYPWCGWLIIILHCPSALRYCWLGNMIRKIIFKMTIMCRVGR